MAANPLTIERGQSELIELESPLQDLNCNSELCGVR